MAYAKELTEETALPTAPNVRKDYAGEVFMRTHEDFGVENELNLRMNCSWRA
jgi:hypothetical protein